MLVPASASGAACLRLLHSLSDDSAPTDRFGCAAGKHRARAVGLIVADWLSRDICPAVHLACASDMSWITYGSVSQALDVMLQWQSW